MYDLSCVYEIFAEAGRNEESWCLPLSNLEYISVLVVLIFQLFNTFESSVYMYIHTYTCMFHYILRKDRRGSGGGKKVGLFFEKQKL